MSGRRNIDLCNKKMVGTLAKQYRTVNRDSEFGSEYDICATRPRARCPPHPTPSSLGPVTRPRPPHTCPADKHNPWRAPGNAPTADACGLAGGTPWPQEASEAGDYTTTVYAHHGMNGSALKPLYTGVQWTIGTEAEVTWQISNNHGTHAQLRSTPSPDAQLRSTPDARICAPICAPICARICTRTCAHICAVWMACILSRVPVSTCTALPTAARRRLLVPPLPLQRKRAAHGGMLPADASRIHPGEASNLLQEWHAAPDQGQVCD